MALSALRKEADVFRLDMPASGEVLYFDEGKPSERAAGLALRVRAGGSRRWVYFYRLGGKQLKHTIGAPPEWSLEKARSKAHELRVKVDNGENPAAEKVQRVEAAKLSLGSVIEEYLKERARKMRPRSLAETQRHLRRDWKPLHGMPLSGLTRAMVAGRLSTLAEGSDVVADHARSALSAMYVWAIGRGWCDANPVTGTNKHGERKPRERVLSDAELVKIWQAATDDDYGRIIKMLLLTGQRRNEIGGLRWSEIDTDKKLIVLPSERTKNSLPHEVPLSDMALDILGKQQRRLRRELVFGEGEGGFSGWSKSKLQLDAAAKVTAWRVHDLRRTAATRMADLGVQPHVIEAVLNHISGHKSGVAGIYNRSTYSPEKRAALELWANHLKVELAKAEGANIHRLKTRG